MSSKWLTIALLFSTAVNMAALGTLVYLRLAERHEPGEYRMPPGGPRPFTRMEQRSQRERFKNPEEMDSLQLQYRLRMMELLQDIEKQRRAVALELEKDPIDRKVVNEELRRLFESRLRAESMTVDHLIALKPKLPPDQWRILIRRMQMPPRRFWLLNEETSLENIFQETKEEKRIIINQTPKLK